MGVGVVLGSLLLLAIGLLVAWRWGDEVVLTPWEGPAASAGDRLVRYVWWLAVAASTWIAVALTVVGPGGRLAMRLLAATAGDRAQRRITEADEVVGEITLEGTIGLFIFVGLLGSLAATAAYFLTRRWLPAGRAGGLALGIGLLVVVSREEPLRRDNPDFDIVGPGWLSIAVFAALAVATGLAVVAFAAAASRRIPTVGGDGRGSRAAYLALVPVTVIVPVAVVAVLGAAVAWALPGAPRWWRSDGASLAGRVALTALILVALPSFLGTVADIAGRGP